MNEIKTFEERKKSLLAKGKERGYITFEELADELKGLELDSDSLDELYNTFHDLNIEIVSEDVEGEEDKEGAPEKDLLQDISLPKR